MKLIERLANVDKKRRRHNEIYFRLRDEGIYLLFLKMRYHGILVDQLTARKSGIPISYVDDFIKYYGNYALFNLFLYPYFEKQTIAPSNINLLVKLFKYLHNCCKQIDAARIKTVAPHRFFWSEIPGEGNSELLTSLREIFALQNADLDNCSIEKAPDNSTITVTGQEIGIVIKLDETRKKAIATVDMAGYNHPRSYEYIILYHGPEIIACVLQEDKSQLDSRRLLEVPIYELVCDIGRESGALKEQTNISELLAQDDNFMKLVDQACNDFNKGYNYLINLRDNYLRRSSW